MTSVKTRIFLAGIIQGSCLAQDIHSQDYRNRIKRVLKKSFPEALVYCPVENHPDSVVYEDRQASEIFLKHLDMVKQSHLLVVYLPEASMGSAIEMWEASRRGVPVVTITPMKTNWVVRLVSDVICPDLDQFEAMAESGALREKLGTRFPKG